MAASMVFEHIRSNSRTWHAILCYAFFTASSVLAIEGQTKRSQDDHPAPPQRITIGLVEISALATLIGAASAEGLASGSKGAAGIPWAGMSAFGSLYVAKAALACLLPDWAREASGLRSPLVDASLGFKTPIRNAKLPMDTLTACAVWMPYLDDPSRQLASDSDTQCRASPGASSLGRTRTVHWRDDLTPRIKPREPSWNFSTPFTVPHCAFALDRNTARTLETIAPSENGVEIKVHAYRYDGASFEDLKQWKDWAFIALSTAKLAEMGTLYYLGSQQLWWATGLSWAPSLVCSVLLQLFDLGRNSVVGEIDLLWGDLPSPLRPGGSGKIVLGMPANPLLATAWKIYWFVQVMASVVCLLSIFITLGTQNANVIYFWSGFQIIWLMIRIWIFHSNWLPYHGLQHALIMAQPFKKTSVTTARRVMELVFALARQQITIHPRSRHCYSEDVLSNTILRELWSQCKWTIQTGIPIAGLGNLTSIPTALSLRVLGVLGDTVLRSTSWVSGLGLSNPELYDTALVFFQLSGSTEVFCVPCARVLSGTPVSSKDEEDRTVMFSARGTTNTGIGIQWILWIPAVDEQAPNVETSHWVELRGIKIVRQHDQADVLNGASLQAVLGTGLSISFRNVSQVEEVIKHSRTAGAGLMAMVEATKET